MLEYAVIFYEEASVTEVNKRVVQRREDGRTEVCRPGAARASAIGDNQAQGIARARAILGNDGGGQLQVRSVSTGQIHQQDTTTPGSDPRRSEG